MHLRFASLYKRHACAFSVVYSRADNGRSFVGWLFAAPAFADKLARSAIETLAITEAVNVRITAPAIRTSHLLWGRLGLRAAPAELKLNALSKCEKRE